MTSRDNYQKDSKSLLSSVFPLRRRALWGLSAASRARQTPSGGSRYAEPEEGCGSMTSGRRTRELSTWTRERPGRHNVGASVVVRSRAIL